MREPVVEKSGFSPTLCVRTARFAFFLSTLIFVVVSDAHGAFALNFDVYDPNDLHNSNNNAEYRCGGFRTYSNEDCSFWSKPSGQSNYSDTTPIVQEVITSGGVNYWHVVVGEGSNADGSTGTEFRQDTYIRMGTAWTYLTSSGGRLGMLTTPAWNNSTPSSGTANMGFSESGGFPSGIKYSQMDAANHYNCDVSGGNGCDPLAQISYNSGVNTITHDNTWTGTGTGNPTRMVMRQINETTDAHGTFKQEFLKDSESNKPRITQTLTLADAAEGDLSLEFKADMRGIGYSDMSSPLAVSGTYASSNVFVNNQTLSGGSGATATPGDLDFNMAADQQSSNVTAGRYTYTPGSGWLAITFAAGPAYAYTNPVYLQQYYQYWNGSAWVNKTSVNTNDFYRTGGDFPLYSAGTYSYAEGGFDHMSVDWSKFMNASENPCGGDPFC